MKNENITELTLIVFIEINFIYDRSSNCARFNYYNYLNFIRIMNDEKQSVILRNLIRTGLLKHGKMKFCLEFFKFYYGINVKKLRIDELDLILYNVSNKYIRETLKDYEFILYLDYIDHFNGFKYLDSLKNRFKIDPSIVYDDEGIEFVKMNDNLFKHLAFFIECSNDNQISQMGDNSIKIFSIKDSLENFLSVFYAFLKINIFEMNIILLDFYCLSHYAKFELAYIKIFYEGMFKEINKSNKKFVIITENSEHLDELGKLFLNRILTNNINHRILIINLPKLWNNKQQMTFNFKQSIHEFNLNNIMKASQRFQRTIAEIYDKNIIIKLFENINHCSLDEFRRSKQFFFEFLVEKVKKIDFVQLEKLINPIN